MPGLQGLQFFSTQPGVFDAKGTQIYASGPFPPETIWWDADLGREFVSTIGASATSPGIDKFNTTTGGTDRLFSIYSDPQAPSSPYNNYIAYGGRPQFWGDILGDWREELLCVASDNSELRIYTTKIADIAKTGGGVPLRIYTLMHNPQYRIQATTKGYVQSSYVDYYLGYNMTPPQPPPMVDAKLVWRGGAGATAWDAGTTQSWLNNTASSAYADGDTVRFDISGNNATTVALTGMLQPGAVTVYNPKDYTFGGTGTLAGAMKLMKAGAGTLIVPGNHAFTGKTTVWDGALLVNGDLTQSPVTVWGGTWGGALAAGKTGGRIGGTGRFSQPVALKYRAAITPGAGMNSAGTTTFGSGLTAEDGSTFALDLSDDPSGTTKPNDRIAVTGNLALSGTVHIVVNPLNTQLAAGTYTLLTYSGTLTGGVANLAVTLPAGTPYTVAAAGGAVTLTVPVTRAPASIVWAGGVVGNKWDLAASQNWKRSGATDVFVAGDTVLFDATGAANPTVTLSTALPIAGAAVNAATDYTLTGAGSLTGAGGLVKSGAGTLTVSTTNDFTGPTTITGGVLAVAALGDAGTPSSIGAASTSAGNLVINGGTLRLTGSQTNTNRNATLGAAGGTIDIATAGSSLQISGALSGAGRLTKAGPGTLLLASANTYSGGTTIDGGTIYLAGATPNVSGLGGGAITINNGTLTMSDVQASETAAWNLIVPAGATARLNADGRCSLTGTLTGAGAFTCYTGYIRTDLAGNWSAFTGQIFAVTDTGGGDFRITNTAGFPNAALDLGDQVFAYYNTGPPSGGQTIDIGALSGVASANLKGGPTGGRTVTYRIGGKNTDSVFNGTLTDSAGPTALTKLGTGAFTLAGACTYTGATTVSAGALLVNGSLTGTNVTVQNGATLGGSGAITGNVTVSTGGRLAFVASGGAITGLTITGNLTMNGTVTVTPAAGSGAFAQGTYTIATYTGALAGSYTLAWLPPAGSSQTASFDTSTPGVIRLTVARNAATLTWTGAAGSAWDTTTANWLLNSASELFVPPDSALFDDTAIATAVALAGPLAPGTVTFSNSAKNYTLSGTGGGLSGSAVLVKNGAGTLTLSTANAHTGGTTVNAGTLTLANDTATSDALGTGPITLIGGTVQMFDNTASFNAATWQLSVPAGANGTLRADSRIDLYGTLTGSGTLNLYLPYIRTTLFADWSAFTGRVNVTSDADGGDFRVANANGYAATALTLGAKVSAYYYPNETRTVPVGELTGDATAKLRGIVFNNNAVGAYTLTWQVGALGTDATFAGAIANGTSPSLCAVEKVGAGTWTLSGASTYTGATSVTAGVLKITGSVSGTAALTVAAGAALELSTGTLAVAGPVTNSGTVRLYGPAALSSTGAFTNNGVLDLINAPPTLPANFVNHGTVLDSTGVRVQQAVRTGADIALTIQSHAGHHYQLQRRDSLTTGAWADLGAAQAGTSGVLTFTDTGGATGPQRYYRVSVAP